MWPDDIVPLLHRKVDEVQPNDWIILANSFFHILDYPFAFVAYTLVIEQHCTFYEQMSICS